MKRQLLYSLLFSIYFSLSTFAQIANQPSDYEVCNDSSQGEFAQFDLSFKDAEVLGTQNPADFSVSYFETQSDADTNANPLTNPYNNFSNPQIVFVRLESLSSGAFDTTSLTLIVAQSPVVFTPTALKNCDPDGDGFGVFTLSDADAEIIGGAPNLTVTYHETAANAINGVSSLPNIFNNFVSNTQTVFARVENTMLANNCASLVNLELNVFPAPIISLNYDYALNQCDDLDANFNENNDGFASFNLTQKVPEITEGNSNYTVSFYETNADAQSTNNVILNETAYTNLINPQTLYVSVSDTTTGCKTFTTLTIRVLPNPSPGQPNDLEVCDDNDDGFFAFDLTVNEPLIINGEPGQTITYYTSEVDALTSVNPIPNVTQFVNTTLPQTIYARAENNTTGCFSLVDFDITVLTCVDSDSDGVNDDDEDLNNNGNLDDDDTDMDLIPNYLDDDDDGDNVDTLSEINIVTTKMAQHPFVDTDGDLVENYLDDDDDGDSILTVNEDYNNNGDPTDDDTDFSGTPDYLEINVALSVNDFNIDTSFSFYPNPVNSILNIKLKNPSNGNASIEIIELQGKIVLQKSINESLQLNVKNLQAGLYFIKLKQNDTQTIKKLIID